MSCSSKKIVVSTTDTNTLEAGKCYYSMDLGKNNETKNHGKWLLEIIPEKYQEVSFFISKAELISKADENKIYTHMVKPYSLEFTFHNEMIYDVSNKLDPSGYVYCLVEKSPVYKRIDLSQLEDDRINLVYFEKIEDAQLTRFRVKKEPKKLTDKQYYIEGVNWSPERELVLPTSCFQTNLILLIKERLVELGYELDINNTMDIETRKAFLDFQANNNITSGVLDKITIDLLKLDQDKISF